MEKWGIHQTISYTDGVEFAHRPLLNFLALILVVVFVWVIARMSKK
jgi:hypothetical protein